MKIRINLETLSDVTKFVAVTEKIPGKVCLTDGMGLKVNAKSLMGVIYTLEFEEIWVESDKDIYSQIAEFTC